MSRSLWTSTWHFCLCVSVCVEVAGDEARPSPEQDSGLRVVQRAPAPDLPGGAWEDAEPRQHSVRPQSANTLAARLALSQAQGLQL